MLKTDNKNPLTELVNALANNIAGVSGGKATAAELNSSGLSTNAANSFCPRWYDALF